MGDDVRGDAELAIMAGGGIGAAAQEMCDLR